MQAELEERDKSLEKQSQTIANLDVKCKKFATDLEKTAEKKVKY